MLVARDIAARLDLLLSNLATNSAEICCASAALPPLPAKINLLPFNKAFADFSASLVLIALPAIFLTIFCATAKPVPYCVSIDVNLANVPASPSYILFISTSPKACSTLSNISVSKYKSDK